MRSRRRATVRRPGTWTRRLREEGHEPDPRFSFANERTFLAWIRTSLALIAAGLGVDAFATDLPSWGRTSLAGMLVFLGGMLAASSFQRWFRAELAMRHSAPLPLNRLAPILGVGISLGAALALVLLLSQQ
jgi:putative membrane protein